jgi:hypothetical protein
LSPTLEVAGRAVVPLHLDDSSELDRSNDSQLTAVLAPNPPTGLPLQTPVVDHVALFLYCMITNGTFSWIPQVSASLQGGY